LWKNSGEKRPEKKKREKEGGGYWGKEEAGDRGKVTICQTGTRETWERKVTSSGRRGVA